MADRKDDVKEAQVQEPMELTDEELASAAGGSLKGNIIITPTTDISEDTRDRI